MTLDTLPMKGSLWKHFHHYFIECWIPFVIHARNHIVTDEGILMKAMKFISEQLLFGETSLDVHRPFHHNLHSSSSILNGARVKSDPFINIPLNCVSPLFLFHRLVWSVWLVASLLWKRASSQHLTIELFCKRHYDEHSNTIQFNKSIQHVSSILCLHWMKRYFKIASARKTRKNLMAFAVVVFLLLPGSKTLCV